MPASSRPLCPDCTRPLRGCLCGCVRPVAHRVQLLILQHPLEVGHPKGTANLLHLCLPHSRLLVGEALAEADLRAALTAPWPGAAANDQVRAVLLYPPTPPDPQLPVAAPPALPAAWLDQPEYLRLVVLDGTWRKSRKMLYLNPALQALPRLPLQDLPASRYRIRKAHKPGQLSTFEASALALAQLEGWPAAGQPLDSLWAAFDALMEMAGAAQAEAAQPDAPAATA